MARNNNLMILFAFLIIVLLKSIAQQFPSLITINNSIIETFDLCSPTLFHQFNPSMNLEFSLSSNNY